MEGIAPAMAAGLKALTGRHDGVGRGHDATAGREGATQSADPAGKAVDRRVAATEETIFVLDVNDIRPHGCRRLELLEDGGVAALEWQQGLEIPRGMAGCRDHRPEPAGVGSDAAPLLGHDPEQAAGLGRWSGHEKQRWTIMRPLLISLASGVRQELS